MNKQRYFMFFLGSLMLALILVLPSFLWPVTSLSAPLLEDRAGETLLQRNRQLAVDGQWTGTTNLNQPVSFNVSSSGTEWRNFKLKTNFSMGGCSGTLEVTIPGPGPISNNQFSRSSNTFSFSGQFDSFTTASGTYAFVNEITGCGPLTQSGTWTASNSTSSGHIVYLPLIMKPLPPPPILSALEDTVILQGYPTQNFCDTVDMWAGYDDLLDPDGQIARSLIKFNVSAIPPGTAISRATLNVRLFGYYDFPNRSRTITAYRVGSFWSACSTTWGNQPVIAEAYGSQSVGQDLGDWYAFDVTDLVRGWINGNFPNHGVWLRGPEVSGFDSSWRGFYTLNSTSEPYLSITYSGVTRTEQSTVPVVEADATMPAPKVSQRLDPSAYPNLCRSNSAKEQKCLGTLP